jgi:hypothetical protein
MNISNSYQKNQNYKLNKHTKPSNKIIFSPRSYKRKDRLGIGGSLEPVILASWEAKIWRITV